MNSEEIFFFPVVVVVVVDVVAAAAGGVASERCRPAGVVAAAIGVPKRHFKTGVKGKLEGDILGCRSFNCCKPRLKYYN
jgi:hypothetical protein